ncbi:CRISPR system precrRNA processing endoribonuclease RAMP protein Cas6 [Promicromonospora sp. NPDC057138]|uniref:CRISPR system precrRNA processing endoribonuclease RAMP protein Cas6 n=1 Tax=Promicromonospora sp. NPDC057138 TaxID=3346031 RepID=UPI00362EF0D2
MLRPRGRSRAQVTPTQLHGLACALFESAGADHTALVKPFSVAPLLATPGNRALLTIGWLDDVRPPGLESITGRDVRLGSQFFTVEEVTAQHVPYAALATMASVPAVTIEFASVTYFKRGDIQVPLPDPGLLYRGLARRWNTFAPMVIDEETLTVLDRTVAVSHAVVTTDAINPGKGPKTGFRGVVTYRCLATSDSVRGVFTALSTFAEHAGVGAQTAHGLGWVKVVLHKPDAGP